MYLEDGLRFLIRWLRLVFWFEILVFWPKSVKMCNGTPPFQFSKIQFSKIQAVFTYFSCFVVYLSRFFALFRYLPWLFKLFCWPVVLPKVFALELLKFGRPELLLFCIGFIELVLLFALELLRPPPPSFSDCCGCGVVLVRMERYALLVIEARVYKKVRIWTGFERSEGIEFKRVEFKSAKFGLKVLLLFTFWLELIHSLLWVLRLRRFSLATGTFQL